MNAKMIAAALTACLALEAFPVGATTQEEKALAQTLFDQGRALAKRGNNGAACPKFEESQRLDPAPGTLINLAVCHEAIGKTATAWIEFNESLSIARKPPVRPDREQVALQHLKDLEPKLSKLTIVVTDAAAEGFAVTLDGIGIGAASFGIAFPVDPGPHSIAATAKGKQDWKTTVTIGAEKDAQTVTVPKLTDLPATTEGTATPSTTTLSSDSSPQKTWGWIAMGAGVAVTGVGVAFALKAHSKRVDGDAAPDASTAAPLYDDARSNLTIARVALGLGVVSMAAGVVLVLTSPKAPVDGTAGSVRLAPAIGPAFSGVSLSGSF